MTRGTADSFLHVNAVIEIHKVRQNVHPIPLDRFIVVECRAHRREYIALRPNLRMAVHTYLDCWHPGKRGGFDCRVAVATIDPVIADVMFVTEWNWLRDVRAHAGGVIRTHKHHQPCYERRENEHRAKDAHPRKRVRASMKNLRHLFFSPIVLPSERRVRYARSGGLSLSIFSDGYCCPLRKI